LRAFENKVLRRIFGLKRAELTGSGRNDVMKSFIICTSYQMLGYWCYQIKEGERAVKYGMRGGNKKCMQKYSWKTGRDQLTWKIYA
jgi:hypothetical protein